MRYPHTGSQEFGSHAMGPIALHEKEVLAKPVRLGYLLYLAVFSERWAPVQDTLTPLGSVEM